MAIEDARLEIKATHRYEQDDLITHFWIYIAEPERTAGHERQFDLLPPDNFLWISGQNSIARFPRV